MFQKSTPIRHSTRLAIQKPAYLTLQQTVIQMKVRSIFTGVLTQKVIIIIIIIPHKTGLQHWSAYDSYVVNIQRQNRPTNKINKIHTISAYAYDIRNKVFSLCLKVWVLLVWQTLSGWVFQASQPRSIRPWPHGMQGCPRGLVVSHRNQDVGVISWYWQILCWSASFHTQCFL